MDNREGPLGWEERNGEVFMQCAIVVGALVPLSLLLAAVAGVSAYVLVPCIGRGLDSQQVQDAIWAIMAAVAFPFVPVLAHGVVTAFRERTVTLVWARLCLKTLGGRYPVLLLLSAVGVAAEAAALNVFAWMPQVQAFGVWRGALVAFVGVAMLALMGLSYPPRAGGAGGSGRLPGPGKGQPGGRKPPEG